jgi:replication fork protection complex subunit Tof1/Swi1
MNSEVLDPELKAHITNLVSALGGPDLDDPDRKYKLGDDALGCLRDLKRWLKSYDDQHEKLDVARAISETSLMTFDLIEILTSWENSCEQGKSNPQQDRIALACLELMVPLTWPLELNKMTANANQYLHKPALDHARIRYKQAVLTHAKEKVLRAVIRLAIPSLKASLRDRTTREDGVLKLAVYFFRNLLAIENSESILDAENDTSTSNTLLSYHKQNVLDFLITIAAGIGTTFEVQDTIVLECLFYMLKGIPVNKVLEVRGESESITPAPQRPTRPLDDLSGLLKREKEMQHTFSRNAATRHNRFGTMVSMIISEDTRLALSGQKGLSGVSESLERLDATKKWHKPLRRKIDEGVSVFP